VFCSNVERLQPDPPLCAVLVFTGQEVTKPSLSIKTAKASAGVSGGLVGGWGIPALVLYFQLPMDL